jgi:hypothetical protein
MRCSTIQLPSDSSSATMNTSSLPLPDVLTHENVAPVRPKATNPLSPWKPQGLPFKSGWVSTCVKIWLAAGDTVQNRSSFSPYSLMDQLRFSSSVAAHKLSAPAACFEALRRGPGTYAESRPSILAKQWARAFGAFGSKGSAITQRRMQKIVNSSRTSRVEGSASPMLEARALLHAVNKS